MIDKKTLSGQLKLVVLFFIILFSAGNTLAAEKYYYRWVDDKGVTHVTDRLDDVPQKHRSDLQQYEKKDNTIFSKFKNYYPDGLNTAFKYKYYIIGLLSFIFLLVLVQRAYKKIKMYFARKKAEYTQRTVLKSGIKKMSDDEFKNSAKSSLLRSGFELKPIDSDFNTLCNFIAVKKRKKFAVHISTDLNAISEIKIKNIEIERLNYECEGSIVIANTKFDDEAINFSKTINCKLIDEAHIAKALVNNGKI